MVVVALAWPAAAADDVFKLSVQPFLKQNCIGCHGPQKPQGKFSLHSFGEGVGAHRAGYAAVLERLIAGDMPPDGEPTPDAKVAKKVAAWIQAGLAAKPTGPAAAGHHFKPSEGNRVPHALLFGAAAGDVSPPPPRLWRMRPAAYTDGFVRGVKGRDQKKALSQPFDLIAEPGIKDYAQLYSVDGAGAEVLLRNAQLLVEDQTAHTFVADAISGPKGRLSMGNDTVREFAPLIHPTVEPTVEQMKLAFATQFRMALVREPTADEMQRVLTFYRKNLTVADRVPAAKTTLMAPLMMPEAIYRFELGQGDVVRPGVRMLSPKEIAFALSLALSNQREREVFIAADKGAITDREQVAAHVRRMLDDPKFAKPRLLGFFREYFGYDAALDVFKDRPDDHIYRPNVFVSDTDRLILSILADDKDVFRELLTTKKSFVNYTEIVDKATKKVIPKPLQTAHPPNDGTRKASEFAYGFSTWPAVQPVELPGDRMGILMQPSWLAAWSGNFENDPVRRGRWIRERLLGGLVPDLPIGVAAKVPDEPHEPLRHRLRVTREAACWKCHQKMDDLGLPFEGFSHYGVARTTETLLDPEATAKHVDKRGKPLGPVKKPAPLLTAGAIAASGDPALDGNVSNAADLVRKLAASDRVRQVFIRHVFRYYMGRNETPGDARTLQEADAAYTASGGSFKALLVSLLSSESFLYRSVPEVGK